MDEEWDAEGKEISAPAAVGAYKWEGEDEDDDVKDNWEDEEEEEKKDVEKQEPQKTLQPKKPKKIRQEKIEEKEQRESERRVKPDERELTPAELQAEKVECQKLEEEADLRVAMETFGSAETSAATGIDAMNPDSKEEFDDLQEALSKKICSYNKSTHFPEFAEELIRNICANLTSYDLKKLKTTVENMFLEKTKVEKGDKLKKNKGKGKATLKVEGENETLGYYEYDEFDDFM